MRVRFAPSPTGHLHVGNARTALFNWLLARGQGGAFIVRIEDTDVERSTLESVRAIFEYMRWIGLVWDVCPDACGAYGPYRQSERTQLYASYARDLIDRGKAYYCFCSPDELEAERKAAMASGQPPKYGGRCRALDPVESGRRVQAGEAAAIRFAVPDNRSVTFADVVRGDVTFHSDVIGDFVIVRSEGRPAYNFAVVVDDALMKITHVIRGEDHISNTPRQVLIYEALGFGTPVFAHLSLVMGPDHAPLSKRHGATSVAEFRERGFLPESLVNYLALLGWSPGEGEELLPVVELARRFDLTRVSHSAAVFDTDKLAWINRHYMKDAPASRMAREALPWFVRAGYLSAETEAGCAFVEALLPLSIGSVDRVPEISERVNFVFEWDAARAAALVAAEADGAKAVAAFISAVGESSLLEREAFRAAAAQARAICGLKGRALFHPLRVALTAAESGPELDLAVPAIDRGSLLADGVARVPIVSCRQRLSAVATLLSVDAQRA